MTDCNKIPSIQDVYDTKQNMDVFNEAITSDSDETTSVDTMGNTHKTLANLDRLVDIAGPAAESAAESAAAAEAAASMTGYQGLWPDTGGSALKGETWQTQVDGTPTGEYFTALRNTTVDPVNDNVNWKSTMGEKTITEAQNDLVGGSIYKGSNGEYVQNGDVVTAGTTHLRVEIDGNPTIVSISPISSGAVSSLTETSAIIGSTQVTFNRTGYIYSVKELLSKYLSTTISYITECHSDGSGLGRKYLFDSSVDKSEHDGVTVISPTVPFTTLASFLKGAGETDPDGSGCWVAQNKSKGKAAFIIDDGIDTQYSSVPSVFESRNVRCGFAIVPELIGNSGRMTGSNLSDLYQRGFEILGHSITDLRTTTSKLLSSAEIKTSYERLRKVCAVSGYVASQSVLSETALAEVKKTYDYAFSALSVAGEYDKDTFDGKSYYNLSRVNLDGANSSNGIPAAQLAAIEGKSVVFYEHLYTGVAPLETILDEIIQYKALDVVLPKECFVKSVVAKSQVANQSKMLNVEGFTTTSGSINTVSASLPAIGDSFFFSPDAAGSNKVFQLDRNCEAGKTYTASMEVKKASGNMSASIGIYFYDATDTRIDTAKLETDSADLDGKSRRYFVSNTAPSNAVSMRVFVRVDVTNNGTLTIVSPRISSNGSMVDGNDSQDFVYKYNLPTQDITVGRTGAGYPDYNFQFNTVDNALFSISGDTITWKKSGTYSKNLYFEGSGPDGCTGLIAFLSTSQNASRSSVGVVSGNATRANGAGNAVIKVTAGDTTVATARIKSNDVADSVINVMTSGNSAIEIQKID